MGKEDADAFEAAQAERQGVPAEEPTDVDAQRAAVQAWIAAIEDDLPAKLDRDISMEFTGEGKSVSLADFEADKNALIETLEGYGKKTLTTRKCLEMVWAAALKGKGVSFWEIAKALLIKDDSDLDDLSVTLLSHQVTNIIVNVNSKLNRANIPFKVGYEKLDANKGKDGKDPYSLPGFGSHRSYDPSGYHNKINTLWGVISEDLKPFLKVLYELLWDKGSYKLEEFLSRLPVIGYEFEKADRDWQLDYCGRQLERLRSEISASPVNLRLVVERGARINYSLEVVVEDDGLVW